MTEAGAGRGDLDGVVVGPTGVCVVGSWPGRAVAETLEGWARVPVRALLCVHSPWPLTPRAADGVGVAAPGQLSGVVRSGPAGSAEDLEQATTRLLEVLRPVA